MAYDVIKFKDRAVENPNTYEMEDGAGKKTVSLTRAPGQVYEEGTPLSAAAMNHLSQGVYAARQTHVEDRQPDKGKNRRQGYETGDRLMRKKREFVNLVPPQWDEIDAWVDASTDYTKKYAFTSGGSTENIRGIKISSLYTADSTVKYKYGLAGFPLDNLVEGHKYFFAATFATPSSFPRYYGATSTAYVRILQGSTLAISLAYAGTYFPSGGDSVTTAGDVFTAGTSEAAAISFELNATLLAPLFHNTVAWLEGLVLLDLTEEYGAGNEPTRSQCMELFSAPVMSTTSGDRERFFEKSKNGRVRYFLCQQSEEDGSEWGEIPMLSDVTMFDMVVMTGYSFSDSALPRYFRFGPFVYFEATLTVTVAMTAGQLKDCMVGLPVPNHTVKVPARANAATANAFFIFDPLIDTYAAKIQTTTAVAVNEVLRFSGIYLARDMGNTEGVKG